MRRLLTVVTLTLSVAKTATPVFAQTRMNRTVIPLSLPGGYVNGMSLNIDQTTTVHLPKRYFLHSVTMKVDNSYGNAAAELYVNSDRKSSININSSQEYWRVNIEQETSSIQLKGILASSSPYGVFNVRAIEATVSETDWNSNTNSGATTTVVVPVWPSKPPVSNPCNRCDQLTFPLYYKTPIGNMANRAIILSDRLIQFANHKEVGDYLLPIKKAAAEARSVSEARGASSTYAKPFYTALLKTLDDAQPYLKETFERGEAFEWATALLTLREQIRDELD